MSQQFLIVDGHSVIFAWPELRALHKRRTASAREQLIKILTAITFGADCVSAEGLRDLIGNAQRSFALEIKRHKRESR